MAFRLVLGTYFTNRQSENLKKTRLFKFLNIQKSGTVPPNEPIGHKILYFHLFLKIDFSSRPFGLFTKMLSTIFQSKHPFFPIFMLTTLSFKVFTMIVMVFVIVFAV